jgi:nickel-dependent lactate racemase
MHRGQSREELESHLGVPVMSRWNVIEHDALDNDSLAEVGITSTGNRCAFNRLIVESALVIGIGSVSYHYFAGFGGGRKLILPGVAGESTILANHRLSLQEDPAGGLSGGCRPGSLSGNPVHEDMQEGARLLPSPVFLINCIPGGGGGIAFLNAGGMVESHLEACRFLGKHFSIPLEKRYRAVIVSAGGYPKDINLLQSHKALRYASGALDDTGIMLVAASCSEGIGSPSYRDSFRHGREGVPDSVRSGYTLNAQTAISTWEMTGRFAIHLMSMLEDSDLSLFGFGRWNAGETAALLAGIRDEDILVIENGSTFLPVLRD